ncbi:hypothetical protein BJ322DRAFT_293700 [Thelephora terrestris]|uniref:Uncharacterized protein n=1 Tax=Thelephora terrestris TaxID=56493 RepID=A0A9P6H6B5_9AGAM|nr:hypothetical protein BJ322DRAFT_293700 [Thelephora terrestris]
MIEIHGLVTRRWSRRDSWDDYRPSRPEHIAFARYMVEVAQVGYQRLECRNVPDWILRFALHSLFLDFPPPAPIAANCLAIAAIDLGCDVSDITTLKKQLQLVLNLINQPIRTAVAEERLPTWKYKSITTILLFAASLEGDDRQTISGATLRSIGILRSKSMPMWAPAVPYITALLKNPSPPSPSLDRLIVFASPDVPWTDLSDDRDAVVRWATTVLAVPYTEESGQSVVDATLQIAAKDFLRPHIPLGVWELFKERTSLPPTCFGLSQGAHPNVIRHVRGLGDLEILTSYFLLVWSERCFPSDDAFDTMEISIREDFCGTWVGQHRRDLVERLKHVLREFARGNDHISGSFPWYVDEDDIREATQRYGKLKDVLAEVERKAAMNLTQYHSTCALPLLFP